MKTKKTNKKKTFGHMKQMTPISKTFLHFNALSSFKLDKFSMFYLQVDAL